VFVYETWWGIAYGDVWIWKCLLLNLGICINSSTDKAIELNGSLFRYSVDESF
jgi:hypothetical protein